MLLAAIRADEDFDPAARTADALADDTSPTDDLGDAASSPHVAEETLVRAKCRAEGQPHKNRN